MRNTIFTSLLALTLGHGAIAQTEGDLAERAAALTDLRAWMGVTITDVAVDGTQVLLTGTANQAPDVSGLDQDARTEAIAFQLSFACNVRPLRDLSLEAELTAALVDPFGNAIGDYPISCDAPATTPQEDAARERARDAARDFANSLPDAPFAPPADLLGVATGSQGRVTLTVEIAGLLTSSSAERREEIGAEYLAAACDLPGAAALFDGGGSLTLDLFGLQGRVAQLQATSCEDYEMLE